MDREMSWLGMPMVGEDEKRREEALHLGVAFVTLGRSDISIQTLVLIPEPLSRTANIIAYGHTEEGIEVALLDLADLEKIDFLRQKYRVNVRLTDRSSIKQGLLLYQKHLKEKFAGMVKGGKEAAESLLKHALESGAQYVHLEPMAAEAAGMVIRYRIEGALHEAMRLPQEASAYIVEQLKLLGRLFPVTTAAQEGTFSFIHNNEEVGVALTSVPTAGGEKLTMRLSRSNTGAAGFSLQSLGFHGNALELVHDALHDKKGMVVVGGAGKTTLLYTMLDHVSGPHASVATVEDEVEFRMPRVHQTVTRPDVGLTSAAALRAVLRQDPDTVLVGDLAAEGTAELALKAAQRGVFILGAIEAQSAAGALENLLSLGLEAADLGSNVRLLVAQRVVPRACRHAKARPLTRDEGKLLEGKVNFTKVFNALKAEEVIHGHTAWKDILFYTEFRCKECPQELVGIQEVLQVAYENSDSELTLLEDALFKAVQGSVGIEEAVKMAGE